MLGQFLRARTAVLCLMLVTAGCSVRGPQPSSTADTASPTPSVSATGSTPTPSQLPPITLKASLDEPPAQWTEVAFLPGGDAEGEIGVDRCYHCEPVVPAALAVDPDGSFWIADTHKHRIAHFAKDGSFLGGIPVETGPADLTFVDDRLYVLLEETKPALTSVSSGRLGDRIIVNDGGKPLKVGALIGGQDKLLALIVGAQKLLGGYWALANVHPATGQITPAPGVEVPSGDYMDLLPLLKTRPLSFELRWSDGSNVTARRDLRFQLVRGGKQLGTTVGDMYVRTSTSAGVATVVSLGNGQGTPVGGWYLEIPADGRAPTFERIPSEGFIGDIRRYITVGTDGRVYWMRLLDDGLHIYLRD
jgi:hypothetical protein